MATLSIRPRRTKQNPFPRRLEPLARWRKENTHYALRADGSVVRRLGSGTWTVITLKGKAKKGLTVDEVHDLLTAAGYTRNGVDQRELDQLPY
jgi:hypothetical protein